MEQLILNIEKCRDGSLNVRCSGDSTKAADLAVDGFRAIANEFPEHADDMKRRIYKDFRRERSKAEVLFDLFLYLLLLIGATVLLLAIVYGVHCIGAAALAWLERVEAAAISWAGGL